MNDNTKRRRAREIALQVLFQKEFVGEIDVATSLSYFRDQLEAPEDSWAYSEKLLRGILTHLDQIDAQLTEKSRNWKLSRMSAVDLCILRIGVFEITQGEGEVPPKVAINEAIEIAKKYGGTESANFINGLLDEVLKGVS
jgi:N utilization substance protein B